LSFTIPGAAVQLDGTYGLRTGELKFHGTVELQAKLSELTTGAKSVLLKMVDPLFETKSAGAMIPITIRGTREKPSVRLEVARAVRNKGSWADRTRVTKSGKRPF
jgi:hypothetical protein